MSAPRKAETAIEAVNVGKRYFMRGLNQSPTLFGAFKDKVTRRKPPEFWALRNVDFSVPKGATFGVIGPNGSGKSSTLGLVAGTIRPTEGTMTTQGRISSLLELGAGFHTELTGRENIFLNASLLGIAREDIARRMDAILEFAGIGDFIDMPVKNYSSGMYVRLGFAVATEVDPDILLIDEVLAVGDINFQKKCLARIQQFQRRGKTLLFVSHDLGTVETFCDEVLLIEKGSMVDRGDPARVVHDYRERHFPDENIPDIEVDEHGTGDIRLQSLQMRNTAGQVTKWFVSGEALCIDIEYAAKKRVEKPVIGVSFKHQAGQHMFGTNTQIKNIEIPYLEGTGIARLHIDKLPLRRGHYFLSIAIHSWDHSVQYHRREDWYDFGVRSRDHSEGLVEIPLRFELL